MEYGRVIHQRLSALARDRYMGSNPGLNFFALLSNEQTEVKRNIVAAPTAFLRNHPLPPQRENDNRQAAVPGFPGVPGDANGVSENAKPKFGHGKGKSIKKKRSSPLSPFGGFRIHHTGFRGSKYLGFETLI